MSLLINIYFWWGTWCVYKQWSGTVRSNRHAPSLATSWRFSVLLNTLVSHKGHIVWSLGHFKHKGKNALGKKISKVSNWKKDHVETAQQCFLVAWVASVWRPKGNTSDQRVSNKTTASWRCLHFCTALSHSRPHLPQHQLWTIAPFPSTD